MSVRLMILAILALNTACKKENTAIQKSAVELLTQKEWILSGYGFDDNKNGVIDNAEESIRDCEKDNTSLFRTNGTGGQFDNTLSCGNGISEQSFTWKFIKGEKALDFTTGIADILKLDENELIIYHDLTDVNGQFARFMVLYTH